MAAATIILCACGCNNYLSPLRVGAFREQCALDILRDVRKLQSLPPATLAMVASTLHDAGAVKLATAAVGSLPFTQERDR